MEGGEGVREEAEGLGRVLPNPLQKRLSAGKPLSLWAGSSLRKCQQTHPRDIPDY